MIICSDNLASTTGCQPFEVVVSDVSEDPRVSLQPFFSSDIVWGIVPFESVWQGFNTIWRYESHMVGMPRLSSGMPNKSVASLSIAYSSLANATKEYIAANKDSDNAKVVQGSRDHWQ